jgi:hypothetical protein
MPLITFRIERYVRTMVAPGIFRMAIFVSGVLGGVSYNVVIDLCTSQVEAKRVTRLRGQ